MTSAPWWSETTGILIGSLGGAGLGSLGGLLGAAIGVCAQRGAGKSVVVGLQVVLASMGVVMLLAGFIAIFMSQPRHVYYPLTLLGGLMAGVLGGLIPVTLTGYRIAEARQTASDAGGNPATEQMGLVLMSPVMSAIVDVWGDRGPYRRWSMAGAGAAAAMGTVGLAGFAGAFLGLVPSEQTYAWGQVAFIMGLMATTLYVMAISMGRRARSFVQILDQQRLAAEELRRS